MKRLIFTRLLALLLVAILAAILCGCATENGKKALSLEGGWKCEEEASLSISQLARVTDKETVFTNTVKEKLSIGKDDVVVLDVYDAVGDITLLVNNKEIAAEAFEAGKCSFDITKAVKKSSNTISIKAVPQGEAFVCAGSRVEITVHSPIYVEDAYTVSDMENKVLKVFAVVNNTTEKEETLNLLADIASMDNNAVSATYSEAVTVAPGQSVVEFSFASEDFIAWSNENPFLYMLSVKLGEETYSDYVGYKTFEIGEEGKFLINGNPILIKAADITADECYAKNLYEILNYIKVAGFNTVHVNGGVATERLLEYCDRLGLFVYEGATTTSVELAKRDRSHVSLCLADGNFTAWESAGAPIAVIKEGSIENVGGGEVKFGIIEGIVEVFENEESLMGLKTIANENIFVKSFGVSSPKDNAVNMELSKELYDFYGLSAVMGVGEVNDVINGANVRENAAILDLVRNKDIAGLCFTTDISRFKTDLTEIINDGINDLRFVITADKTNAYNTEALKVKINLANFGVLTGGKYDILVRLTGQGENPFKKTVSVEIDPEKNIQEIFEGEISLKGLKAGEYVVSAEFYKNAHATCGDKTVYVHDKAALPKLSGKVYALGVEHRTVTALIEEQGATVEKFTGEQKGVIVIGENCTDKALIEKAYANGSKVVILGAQNKETLPVEGQIINNVLVPVLYNNALTENAVNTNSIYQVCVGGRILSDSSFATKAEGVRAMSAFGVGEDGALTAGDMFALYEDKYVLSTLAIEENISNPYAATLLLNALK